MYSRKAIWCGLVFAVFCGTIRSWFKGPSKIPQSIHKIDLFYLVASIGHAVQRTPRKKPRWRVMALFYIMTKRYTFTETSASTQFLIANIRPTLFFLHTSSTLPALTHSITDIGNVRVAVKLGIDRPLPLWRLLNQSSCSSSFCPFRLFRIKQIRVRRIAISVAPAIFKGGVSFSR